MLRLLLACLALIGSVQQPARELTILFIGNSLSSVNDVPGLVRRIGEANGERVRTWSVTTNDFGLPQHWEEGRAAREITRRRPAFVVLQQGPSALPESRVVLRDYAARFAKVIRDAGAKPAMYMVWPSAARSGDFDRVIESYTLAAQDIDAVLLPAGAAWREAWKQDPKLPLYAADAFHPSERGSWLAALVIYCGLTGHAPVDVRLPGSFPRPQETYRQGAAAVLAPRN